MEKRAYGSTDEKLSIVGFGGVCVMNETPDKSVNIVAEAIDRDVNYFDVAPFYEDAQEKLGPALEPHRKKIFLAVKTMERTVEGVDRELAESMRLLKTDYLDLYQLHAVTTSDDVKQILGPGGALEAFVKAREKGIVRYLGFSAHSEEAAIRILDAFEFESVLFPYASIASTFQ